MIYARQCGAGLEFEPRQTPPAGFVGAEPFYHQNTIPHMQSDRRWGRAESRGCRGDSFQSYDHLRKTARWSKLNKGGNFKTSLALRCSFKSLSPAADDYGQMMMRITT